jgi:hypothetical protein
MLALQITTIFIANSPFGRNEGWRLVPDRYDDGGLSGASLDCPALQKLLADVLAGKIPIVVVYKVDRLTRSLADFAKLVELFDQYGYRSYRSPSRSTHHLQHGPAGVVDRGGAFA